MKDLKSLVKKYWYSAAILLLFLIAVFLRVYRLESLPDVLHIDEAGLGYNAWCLAHYGTDRYLNVRPFYPQNFYGGQSPLYTYLLALLIRTVGQGNLSYASQNSRRPCKPVAVFCRDQEYPSGVR